MLFSYKLLQTNFNKKLPNPEDLCVLIQKHVFEIEGTEKKENDFVIDIDILANRSDCLSHRGLARELSAILEYELKENSFFIEKKGSTDLKVDIQDKDCLRYSAIVMDNIEVKESDKEIKELLNNCGINSINNIVDSANLVMIELGQPLHVFDLDKIKNSIIVKELKEDQKITTLDSAEYDLKEGDLVIADTENVLAIAGIKGGKIAEVDSKTKTIVIESANFLNTRIRKTAQRLGFRTDASNRFEHKVDRELTISGIERFCSLIKGDVLGDIIDVNKNVFVKTNIKLELNKIEKLIGIVIPIQKVIKILKTLGINIIKETEESIIFEIPSYRQDLQCQEELIEEVARIYGYDKVEPVTPYSPMLFPERNKDHFWADRVRDILVSMKFTEVCNYSFISEKNSKDLDIDEKGLIEVHNPLSSEYKYLRPNLIINLIKNIKTNLSNYSEIKIFEVGNVFNKEFYKSEIKDMQKKRISGILYDGKNAFFELKGCIDILISELGITQFRYIEKKTESSLWNKGGLAQIKVGDEVIGYIGLPNSNAKKIFGVKEDFAIFDIDFDKLITIAAEESEYREISKYPAITRDVSVLVPSNTKSEDLLNAINSVKTDLMQNVDLIDVFVKDDTKSMLFRIKYQSDNRTLTGDEVDMVHTEVIKVLENKWKVRK